SSRGSTVTRPCSSTWRWTGRLSRCEYSRHCEEPEGRRSNPESAACCPGLLRFARNDGHRGARAIDFRLTNDQEAVREAVQKVCARFPEDYWLARDRDGVFPHELHGQLAADGWLGIAMPEEYGGSGLGITEAALMMQTIAESGAGMAGASAVHMNIFGLNPVV